MNGKTTTGGSTGPTMMNGVTTPIGNAGDASSAWEKKGDASTGDPMNGKTTTGDPTGPTMMNGATTTTREKKGDALTGEPMKK